MNDLFFVFGVDVLYVWLIVVDGLIVFDFNCVIFQDMWWGGIMVVNCICCIWEGFIGMMCNIM